MLRRISLAFAVAAAPVAAKVGSAIAQDTGAGATAAPIDFMLRPTQDADEMSDDDIWNWDAEPEPSLLESEIGPPLAGPTGEEPLGPPLAGPIVDEELRVNVPRLDRRAAADPFAQTGISLGSFVIRPSIEIGVTATDNASLTPDKVDAVGLVVAPELNIRSEGERYEFDADLRGEGVFYDRESFDERSAFARAKLRYDLTTLTSVDLDLGYAHYLEGFNDPDTPGGAAERPAVDQFDATLGVEHRMGSLSARLSGFVDRSVHDEVPLLGGGVASREELDNTQYGVRLRTGVATSATLRPFVEAAVGRRAFDQSVDDSGFERASIWGELRGGIVIDRGDKLAGEISLGYRREDIEDDRLDDLDVVVANASVLWSPRRLTEVRLDFATGINPTSTPDTSATVLYVGTLTLSQNLTARLKAEAGGGVGYEDRIGDDWRDLTFTGFAGASYAFSRTASLEARYVYEHTDRSDEESYDAHEIGVRIRLQR